MLIAVTREVSTALERCELSYLPRTPIDVELARRQHRAYREALETLGCRVVALPEVPEQADSVFVEDTAVVLDEIAVITRPGAESRRAETESMARALAEYRELVAIETPGRLDGGDVLRVGRTLYVGQSARSDRAGIGRLAAATAAYGYEVVPVEIRGCLHLKTAVTQVAPGLLLINPAWVERRAFHEVDFLEVDPAEPHAANAVWLPGGVIYPRSFPRTRERLAGRRVPVVTVDMSETEKAEGGVTCCSLIFRSRAEAK
ncbi:MAG TPA: arginine deiminase-related protein [Gammaproteobacteria bacterium]|nr:arginine deiminase-related protein [Gammaproteobacteria bacterium]